jgi:hypothetical protein
MKLRSGDWVEIRSKEDILRTLNEKGQLDEMPFMPQMFKYCGQRFRVYKRAHKTCDTINPIRSMRVADAVHLELRCDGEAYGGCQARCLIFWKTAWLKRVIDGEAITLSVNNRQNQLAHTHVCTEADVWKGTRALDENMASEPRYVCQATQVPYFGDFLPWWDLRQYLEDYTSGNAGAARMLRGLVYASYSSLVQAGIGLGPLLSWVYDLFQSLWGGIPWPRRSGSIPVGQPTPACTLNLEPGELVRVKSYKEILATLDTEARNRGLMWDREMVPYCGGVYRVKTRLSKFIDEKTGKLCTTKSPAIILDGVWCGARYSDCRMYCPRGIYSWWREIWLERISEEHGESHQGVDVVLPLARPPVGVGPHEHGSRYTFR